MPVFLVAYKRAAVKIVNYELKKGYLSQKKNKNAATKFCCRIFIFLRLLFLFFYNMHIHLREWYIEPVFPKFLIDSLVHIEIYRPVL